MELDNLPEHILFKICQYSDFDLQVEFDDDKQVL